MVNKTSQHDENDLKCNLNLTKQQFDLKNKTYSVSNKHTKQDVTFVFNCEKLKPKKMNISAKINTLMKCSNSILSPHIYVIGGGKAFRFVQTIHVKRSPKSGRRLPSKRRTNVCVNTSDANRVASNTCLHTGSVFV